MDLPFLHQTENNHKVIEDEMAISECISNYELESITEIEEEHESEEGMDYALAQRKALNLMRHHSNVESRIVYETQS
eukprot:CAMPEP_0202961238 /NCGR_PEP_ID=MMETSP1396-20130829/5293_1 /ASSEMBLY_ACC=CAM_ASM_000872 /TAXON_ID= /ORGANISM="Pseudokeronopsis sp., Strain Brazil" /LENGTH=76 /DNA_ID=CAMNT_0049680911 /DNA_START=393 /DNA_END=623 /DNA_ORIENTATION=+